MDKPVWQDRSEIVAGLILNEHLDVHMVDLDSFVSPYNEIIGMVRKGSTIEDIVSAHGFSYVKAAQMAAEAVNGDKEHKKKKPIDWVNLLEQAASFYKHGDELEKMSTALKSGQPIDPGKLLQFASGLDLGYRTLTPLDQVEPEEGQWIETGYPPVDEFFGGVPKAGLTLLAGPPGLGKTTLALKIGLSVIRKYKGNKRQKIAPGKIAIFSLEMLLSQVVARYFDLDENITKEERSRILGSESSYTVGEIYAVAARTAAAEENLKLIIIDFADMLVEGEQSEAVMGVIYRTLALLAKTTGVPVLLVCGVNRNTYEGGIPKINHIRYSSMAEYMASLIWLLYNPATTFSDAKDNKILPFAADRGYLIGGKSRFGFKKGKPGAVQIGFTGETGWEDFGFHYFPVHV